MQCELCHGCLWTAQRTHGSMTSCYHMNAGVLSSSAVTRLALALFISVENPGIYRVSHISAFLDIMIRTLLDAQRWRTTESSSLDQRRSLPSHPYFVLHKPRLPQNRRAKPDSYRSSGGIRPTSFLSSGPDLGIPLVPGTTLASPR
jgi:hypothetical protein